MLLVVTNKTDLASDYLIIRLKERCIPFARLNTEDLGSRFSVDISITRGEEDFEIRFSDGRTITRNNVMAVYLRQPLGPMPPDDVAPSDRDFVKREMAELLRSLWRLIDRDKWFNHPGHLWLASNKVEQLSIASSIGFAFPETLVSGSKESVTAFFADHDGRVICKAVKHGFTRDGNTAIVAGTQRIDDQFINSFSDFALVPMIYQREIPKTFDVRVTVVGNNVFATAIHSQEFTETEVDWRVWDIGNFDLKHERITLPKTVADNCRRITRHFSLRYSAIDLVLGKDDEFYFLEMNPNGQWAWIERKTGYPIRDAIIRCMGFCNASLPV